jgi:hypothetical protein
MAKNNPPDGYSAVNCTWGTDLDHNTALTNLVGDSCVEFKNTTPASNPILSYKKSVPIEEGKPYKMTAIVRADSVAAGNTLRIYARWYDSSDSGLSNSNVYNAVLPAINTWYEMSGVVTAPANARGVRPRVNKANNAFTAYCDYMAIEPMPQCFHAYLNGVQGMADGGTWRKVHFDTEVHDYGGVYDHAVNYVFTAPSDGVYAFNTVLSLAGASSGTTIGIRFARDTGGGPAAWVRGQQIRMQANTYTPFLVGSATGFLNRADTVEVQIWHNEGALLNLSGGSTANVFMGAKVE